MSNTPLPEPAPPHSLPDWGECALRVGNSNFTEKRHREGGYGPEPDSVLATQLHRFIYEYDDTDPYRSAWFMHRLELMLTEHAAAVTAAKDAEIAGLRDELLREHADHKETIEDAATVVHQNTALRKRVRVLEDALTKIDAIRNDIIGRQKIGWSSHVYPLVAALDEAGYPGMEYGAARAALGDSTSTTQPPSPSPRS